MKDMHIFLTGASTGIGNAIARELDTHYKGEAAFSLVSRKKDLLDDLAKTLKGKASVFAADLSEPSVAEMTLDRAVKENGAVDILINNAGMQHIDHFTAIANDDAEQMVRLNYTTPSRLMRKALPAMAERNTGIIINIASLGGITPTPYMSEYCATKAALAALSVALAGEYKDSKLQFITVYPGPVETPMAEKAHGRFSGNAAQNVPYGTPEGLAKEIRLSIEKKRAKIVYPAVYKTAEMFRDFAIWVTAQMAPKPK